MRLLWLAMVFFLFLNDSIFYSSIFILSAQLRNTKYGNNIDNTNKYIKSIRCRLNNRNNDNMSEIKNALHAMFVFSDFRV